MTRTKETQKDKRNNKLRRVAERVGYLADCTAYYLSSHVWEYLKGDNKTESAPWGIERGETYTSRFYGAGHFS